MFTANDQQAWKGHPMVNNIPWEIWVGYFQYSISRAELVRLYDSIEDSSIPLVDGENPLKAYLAFFYKHTALTDIDLIAASRRMGVPLSVRITVAAITQRNGLLCNLPNDELRMLPESIKKNEGLVLKIAVRNGNFGLMFGLLNLVPTEEIMGIIVADNFRLIHIAARQGHLALLNLLISKLPIQSLNLMLRSEGFSVFHEVLQAKNVIAFKRLVDLAKNQPDLLSDMISADDYQIHLRTSIWILVQAAIVFLLTALQEHERSGPLRKKYLMLKDRRFRGLLQ